MSRGKKLSCIIVGIFANFAGTSYAYEDEYGHTKTGLYLGIFFISAVLLALNVLLCYYLVHRHCSGQTDDGVEGGGQPERLVSAISSTNNPLHAGYDQGLPMIHTATVQVGAQTHNTENNMADMNHGDLLANRDQKGFEEGCSTAGNNTDCEKKISLADAFMKMDTDY